MAFDMSQYVIVADPSECIRLAREASAVEGAAMQHDVEGRRGPAVKAYRRAAERLGEAAQACPEGHPDVKLLEQHIQEMLGRANYLEGLSDKPTSVIPLEEHIQDVQLTLGSPDFLDEGVTSPGSQYMKEAGGERKVMGAAAAVGGAAGLLLLGPLGGAALGVATAFATTREDQAGEAARKVGDVGVRLLDKAERLNREHRISRRVASLGLTALSGTTSQAKLLLGKLADRHKVIGQLGRGISVASSTLASATA